jgi:hypothetical protein
MFKSLEKREVRLARRAPGTNFLPILVITGMMLLLSVLLRARAGSPNHRSPATAAVPAGTRLMVKMIDSVDSDKSNPNDRFRGSVEANLMAGSVVVAQHNGLRTRAHSGIGRPERRTAGVRSH